MRERMSQLNERLTKLASDCGLQATLEGRYFFTLTLLTDLVLPPAQALRQLLESSGWQWETAVLHWTRLGGFNEMSGHSKPLVPVLERGGAVLLSVPEAKRNELAQQLATLEHEGLGLLRDQGFGWVRGCHDFHYTHVEVRRNE